MPSAFGRLMRVMLGDDPDAVLAGLRAEGFVRPDRTVDAAKLIDYLSPFSEPARHEVFTYSREWLAGEFARVNDPRNPEFGVALKLEHLPPSSCSPTGCGWGSSASSASSAPRCRSAPSSTAGCPASPGSRPAPAPPAGSGIRQDGTWMSPRPCCPASGCATSS